ncbi:MAG: shikimate dehydrogenase [Chitinophagaceae bacterium]|jgi:shikimate dehydrogenase|nr:shikimate dehydrogenase [Chitinophagaceae bacterium]MBP6047107.1 shikimate dehydrogenase [Ferruginibacter sp.]NMD28251.1 shikimate dehydrogenase [Bacteroidota bacterium]MBK7089314.1 shikimate dehydrogenase [Chitinophagaceae bacterium]MBK7345641.1 shikimate dehydrogenase [Chitinophagaceae bacterium]
MKVYGLLGFPLSVSFSKKYFTEKFEKEKLTDCEFELFPISSIENFPDILAQIKNLKGLAVTIPHKQAVIPFLTHLDFTAKEIGAVNCIKINGKKLSGYNTDALGFKTSFEPLLQPQHNKALVLGTGGASRAVQYVLKQLSIPFLLVSTSKKEKNCIGYNEVNKSILEEYYIIINCTPVGMLPNETNFPDLPYASLSAKHLLYDLIYKPAETQFLAKGKAKGCLTKNGFEMLLIQAEENWRIWNSD